MIDRKHVVAENAEEVEKFELRALRDALEKKFGSRGLEFLLEEPSVDPPGFMALVSRQHTGFAIFNFTVDKISDFVKEWCNARGASDEIGTHEDLY
jgi:hypothetical protein